MNELAPGVRVRLKADPGRVGVLTGEKLEHGRHARWQVIFPEGSQYVIEPQLEPVVEEQLHPIELIKQGQFGRARDLRGVFTHIRLNGRLANVIYSMETTNTDFYPYQFKPVLNFLEAPGRGILIADEVGLGKTIEAGLIWTELRSRFDSRRLIVLCPKMLQEKWQRELRHRFGVQATIVNASDTVELLRDLRDGRRHDCAVIASMQGLRPRREWENPDSDQSATARLARLLQESAFNEDLIDLLVIDEAHYLRNPETATHAIGRMLVSVAEHVVLLSATPIHLRNRDLFQLLNLLDEDTFDRLDSFDLILEANAPILRARDRILKQRLTPEEFVGLLDEASSHPLLWSNRQLQILRESPPTMEELADHDYRSRIGQRLDSINLLSHAVTRTRKRDVQEWRVVRHAVPERISLTAVERDFYDAVTNLVREFAEKRAAHEGFLLVSPQRQVSSSMPAALRDWQRRGAPDPASIEDDLGADMEREDEPSLGPGPLIGELIRKAHKLGDLEALRASDSKYQRLREMLVEYLKEHPKEKIVLFAFFWATLDYLQERLERDGIRTALLRGGGDLDKEQIIESFRDDPEVSVLLSSEVASEGIDLQFSRVLVNYDLPWNPMKVEQRIGRIDRLGQKAPSITVWNLFYEDTIDSRIYDRLYRRLGIFQQALGDLEAILGDEIRKLTMELLRGRFSREEEEARIEQTTQAIANRTRQEEGLEEEAGNLIAHGDYILNQVKAARELQRWITGEDLWLYVRDFYEGEFPGTTFRQAKSDELLFDVSLSPKARAELDYFLRQRRLPMQTRLLGSRTGSVLCRFANRTGVASTPGEEAITQFHPLVRFASHRRKENGSHWPTAALLLRRTNAPAFGPGTFVFWVEQWSVTGLRDIEHLEFVARSLAAPEAPLSSEDAERLVSAAARYGLDWHAASNELDLGEIVRVTNACLNEADEKYDVFVQQVEAENNDRADLQKQSLERHQNRQLERLETVREKHKEKDRSSLVKATEGQMRALKDRVQQRLYEIESRRRLSHARREVCAGVVRIE